MPIYLPKADFEAAIKAVRSDPNDKEAANRLGLMFDLLAYECLRRWNFKRVPHKDLRQEAVLLLWRLIPLFKIGKDKKTGKPHNPFAFATTCLINQMRQTWRTEANHARKIDRLLDAARASGEQEFRARGRR